MLNPPTQPPPGGSPHELPGFDPAELAGIATSHLREEIIHARQHHAANAAADAVALLTAASAGLREAYADIVTSWLDDQGRPCARTHVLAHELLTLTALAVSLPYRAKRLPAEQFPLLRVAGSGGAASLMQDAVAQVLTAIVRGNSTVVAAALSEFLDPHAPDRARLFLIAAGQVGVASLHVQSRHTRTPLEQLLAQAGARAALVA